MDNQDEIILRLYVIGNASTTDLISKLKKALDASIRGYQLDIVDILKNPQQTLSDHILASPTLIRIAPPPEKRIIGNIPFQTLIQELNLPTLTNSEKNI